MVTQIGKNVEHADESIGNAAERAARNVEDVAGRAAEHVGETVEFARQYATDGLDRVEIAIRRNPLAATAIAAGIGFFFAALARR